MYYQYIVIFSCIKDNEQWLKSGPTVAEDMVQQDDESPPLSPSILIADETEEHTVHSPPHMLTFPITVTSTCMETGLSLVNYLEVARTTASMCPSEPWLEGVFQYIVLSIIVGSCTTFYLA